jgi:dihydroorotase
VAETFDLILRGGQVFSPGGLLETDVGVRDGRIVRIGQIAPEQGGELFDARGLTVLPGVIDTQVHFREPGNEHKEDLATGSAAAVAGGVTAVFEMPNTSPSTTTAEAMEDKLKRAAGRMLCDHAFFIGAADNADHLADLERMPGCCGVKIFMGSSTGSLLVEDDAALAKILAAGRRRVAIHAEDEPRLKERKKIAEESGDVADHPNWRDVESALKATHRIVALAREANRPIHVLHITTAEELEFLAGVKDVATVEATPQHLTMAAPDCYTRMGTLAQMNPPIREARHRDALWQAVREGVVDVLGSDHAPHTREEKEKPYPASPSGMPGVETMLPLMLSHVSSGRLSLTRVVDLLCAGPQRIYNIRGKGRIALGYDADFTVVDLKARRTLSHDMMHSKVGWTPFDGLKVQGWPMATIIRGGFAMRDGELAHEPQGKPVRFWDT